MKNSSNYFLLCYLYFPGAHDAMIQCSKMFLRYLDWHLPHLLKHVFHWLLWLDEFRTLASPSFDDAFRTSATSDWCISDRVGMTSSYPLFSNATSASESSLGKVWDRPIVVS